MPSTPIVLPAVPELPPIPSARLSRADLETLMGHDDGFAPQVVVWHLGLDDPPKVAFIMALDQSGASYSDLGGGLKGWSGLSPDGDVHEVSLYAGGCFWPAEDLDALTAWHDAHTLTFRNLFLAQSEFRHRQRQRATPIQHWPFTFEPAVVEQVRAWRQQAQGTVQGWADLPEDVAAAAVVMELLDAIAAGLKFVDLTTHAPVTTQAEVALALYGNDILGFLGPWDPDPMRIYPLFGMRGVVNLPRTGIGNLPLRAVRLLPVQVWAAGNEVEVDKTAAFSFQDLHPGDLVAPCFHPPDRTVGDAVAKLDLFRSGAHRVVQVWHASSGPGRHRVALRELPLCQFPGTREGMVWRHGSTEVLVGYCSIHASWEVEICDVGEQWPDRLCTAVVHDEHGVTDPGSPSVLHAVAVAVLELPAVRAVRRDLRPVSEQTGLDDSPGCFEYAMKDGNLWDPLLRRHGPRDVWPPPSNASFSAIMLENLAPSVTP